MSSAAAHPRRHDHQEAGLEPAKTAQLLTDWALAAGFDRAGIAALEPSRQGAQLRAWLARGEHAAMAWMARRVEVRENPAQLLPGARSALCVALQYAPLQGSAEVAGDLWPRVARYARGQDYHDLMGARLRALATRIHSAFPGCLTRAYVDTGPILERELAARAGIGAVGKNTNLLNRGIGSWFLLGELLTTLELTPSDPVHDLCGRCTRCLDACPTHALPAPYQLDSNRCISYWTIEHRGVVPPEQRGGIGEWVFGCDICQEVCPWNHRPQVVDHPEFALPSERAALDLAGLLLLGRADYEQRFRHSPLKRAKRAGLQRNAAIAMGNRRDPGYVPALTRALTEGEPVVRQHAAWALGQINDPPARAALWAAQGQESDAAVLAEIAQALAR